MVSPELRRHWATIARLGVIVAITVEVSALKEKRFWLRRHEKTPGARQLVRRFRDQAALRTGSGNARPGRGTVPTPSVEFTVSPRRLPAQAKASTPCGDQLIPWCLQRADTAQSLYFSTRVLAIHNPARCRCW